LLQGRGGDGDDVKTIAGIWVVMGLRVVEMVGDVYKYLSLRSSLDWILCRAGWLRWKCWLEAQ